MTGTLFQNTRKMAFLTSKKENQLELGEYDESGGLENKVFLSDICFMCNIWDVWNISEKVLIS